MLTFRYIDSNIKADVILIIPPQGNFKFFEFESNRFQWKQIRYQIFKEKRREKIKSIQY